MAKAKKAKRKTATRKRKEKIAALNIVRMKLKDLKPHPRNKEVRNHPKKGSPRWETLKRSLKNDYFDPLVFNVLNGFLVSGHLRLKIMKELGYTHADVSIVEYDDATHLARLLAANNGMGEDVLTGQKVFLQELNDLPDFEIGLTGFSIPDVSDMLNFGDDEDEDKTPSGATVYTEEELIGLFGVAALEEPAYEVSRGDVYQVGDNYIICADLVRDHALYTPYLDHLTAEFPKRKILFIPAPDPIMIGVVDERVACVMVQPSPTAMAWALTLLNARNPNHHIELDTE